MSGLLNSAKATVSDAKATISGGLSDAKFAADNAAERLTISGALLFMAPDWLITHIQADLRAVGFDMPSAGSQGNVIEGASVGLILAMIISAITVLLTLLFYKFPFFTFCLILICMGLYLFYSDKTAPLKGLLKWTLIISSWTFGLSLLWVILWLGVKEKVPFTNDKHPKDSISYALFNKTAPWAYILSFFVDKDHHRNKIIGPRSMAIMHIGWISLVLLLIVLGTYMNQPKLESFISSVREGFSGKKKKEDDDVEESFVDKSSVADSTDPSDQITLANIQPVSIKQAGFMGPTEKGGKFETDLAVINAIRAGVRFFTLQIDYLETSPGAGFDKINVPTLVYRDNSKAVVSTNGASIADLAKQFSIYAFNPDFPSNTQPLILYLHFVRTPNYITKPDAYMKYLSAVASALAPLQSMIVHGHDTTDFSRQKNERVLLYTPLSAFENKVLILTNADTSVFRNAQKLSMTPVSLDMDLDYMTAMRVYLDDEKDSFGVTSVASEGPAYAVIASYSRIKAMKGRRKDDDKKMTDFALKGKGRFVIAMPGQMENPSQDDINKLLTKAGVNTVPMNLFGTSDPDIKKQITLWGGNPFYRLKPALLQSTKVAVVGYTPPPNVFV